MKKTMSFIAVFMVVSFFTAMAHSEEPAKIGIELPPNFAKTTCPAPVWNNLEVVWDGVTDKRDDKSVGTESKGKDETDILTEPEIAVIFDKSIKDVLTACGMKIVAEGKPVTPHISADVETFFAGVKKKTFTGTAEAKSMINLKVLQGGYASSLKLGFEIESKKLRSGNLKQIKKILDELFAETLAQIPKNKDMLKIF